MTTLETTQVLWEAIPGAEPLFALYGYWPTLHDAVVRAFKVGFAERELILVVDYSDLVLGRESEPNTRTQITMRWFGITECTLHLHNGDLYGMEFTHANGFLKTQFEDYAYGLDGSLLSEGVEVIDIELSPVRPQEERLELTLG